MDVQIAATILIGIFQGRHRSSISLLDFSFSDFAVRLVRRVCMYVVIASKFRRSHERAECLLSPLTDIQDTSESGTCDWMRFILGPKTIGETKYVHASWDANNEVGEYSINRPKFRDCLRHYGVPYGRFQGPYLRSVSSAYIKQFSAFFVTSTQLAFFA